ncbi:uncharacterized protein [Haliotis asinina]|uniref:uncharacterized protein n=1 Tax=Haliotis asinina TaxID=109174 RepID=UPI003531F14E
MDSSQILSILMLVFAMVLTGMALGTKEEQDSEAAVAAPSEHHKRSVDFPLSQDLLDDDAYDMDKRGSLFRFGKRGGLFRFGKRGTLFRFGKRGSTLFRFGRGGSDDLWVPVNEDGQDAKRNFHWGRETEE